MYNISITLSKSINKRIIKKAIYPYEKINISCLFHVGWSVNYLLFECAPPPPPLSVQYDRKTNGLSKVTLQRLGRKGENFTLSLCVLIKFTE